MSVDCLLSVEPELRAHPERGPSRMAISAVTELLPFTIRFTTLMSQPTDALAASGCDYGST